MKIINKILNRLAMFNSGYDFRTRGITLKIVAVTGALTAIVLAVTGAMHLING